MAGLTEGDVLWTPDDSVVRSARITEYEDWLAREKKLEFKDYAAMWEWSVSNLEDFWCSVWEHYRLTSETQIERMLDSKERMPGARWLIGARLNHAAHLLRSGNSDHTAILFEREDGVRSRIRWGELRRSVWSLREGLKGVGVGVGDRVAAWLPNCPEAVIGFLATASLGAIWSSCSSDFGNTGVLDRFGQIGPKVLITADGYLYNGREYPKMEQVKKLKQSLPSVKTTVVVPYLRDQIRELPPGFRTWDDVLDRTAHEEYTTVNSEHPLWILFSSGTTGLPKPIVHSHGGILLEHTKTLAIHNDLKPDDVFFWYTSTGWMMWNYLVGGLIHGSTIVLYDGSPSINGMETLWELAERLGVTYFGTSAAYISSCAKSGIKPIDNYQLNKLRGIGSTGSPLSPEMFEWIYDNVKKEIWLASISGGTDVCTAFVGGLPTLPVKSGRIQCRFLGAKVETFDEKGNVVRNRMGELVITAPMPSMPIYLWNDDDGKRYEESYFSVYPGVWRHGDWATIFDDGTVVIYGRSDATIKRRGIRIGTSEIYRIVEKLPFIQDSLAVDLEGIGGSSQMFLFVVTRDNTPLTQEMKRAILDRLRLELSPRHVPDEIFLVPQIPKTLNGKKLEVPVKRILLGKKLEDVVNPSSLANPDSLQYFVEIARSIGKIGLK
jgi:acetoacetyl-CoA synthetase